MSENTEQRTQSGERRTQILNACSLGPYPRVLAKLQLALVPNVCKGECHG